MLKLLRSASSRKPSLIFPMGHISPFCMFAIVLGVIQYQHIIIIYNIIELYNLTHLSCHIINSLKVGTGSLFPFYFVPCPELAYKR